MARLEAPRGTHDVLPSDQPLWQKVTGEMERLCALYGYRRIQTPVFEDTELFARTSGSGSDIVQKEMYTFEDRGGRSLTLRPEGTAPICRAYIEHGMKQLPQPVKLYTLATMYRYAAPQRGRYREHHQLSLENIGSADPAVDAEVIQYYDTLLRNLGVTRYELQLNSIGDRACRPQYVERLNAWLDANADVLDEDAKQKRATSPLRVFDVKNEQRPCRARRMRRRSATRSATHAPSTSRACARISTSTACRTRSSRRSCAASTTTRAPSSSSSARTRARRRRRSARGGRYDYLVEEIGGPPTPGIGFGAGIERLVLSLELEGIAAEAPLLDVFFASDGVVPPATAVAALRAAGISADLDHAGRSLKGQISYGQKHARAIVLVDADGWTLRRKGELDVAVDGIEHLQELLA